MANNLLVYRKFQLSNILIIIIIILIFNFFLDKAWITLATNDSYSLGALVLAHSLKAVKTVHKLAILITPGVTSSMKYDLC